MIFIFFANNKLRTNIHWPCYCTLHVYAVIPFCDNVISF
jgi:hypothetical protein